jgi:hypothetical protein
MRGVQLYPTLVHRGLMAVRLCVTGEAGLACSLIRAAEFAAPLHMQASMPFTAVLLGQDHSVSSLSSPMHG